MYKLKCYNCGNIIEVDRKAWNIFEDSLNDLPVPFGKSGLELLDGVAVCCNCPDYWAMYNE